MMPITAPTTAFAVSELDRRLANLIRLGVICDIDHQKARVTVTVGNNTTDWLPWLNGSAGKNCHWSPPCIGEQVLLLSPQGDYSQAVVLPGIYQGAFPAPSDAPHQRHYHYADGSAWQYDTQRHHLSMTLVKTGTAVCRVGRTQLSLSDGVIRLNAPVIELNGLVRGEGLA